MKISIFVLIFFASVDTASAYQTQGYIESSDLFNVAGLHTINKIVYSATLPSGTSLKIQFSYGENQGWYNADGVKNNWTTLSAGDNSLDLTALDWNKDKFYYRLWLASDGVDTPVVDSVAVSFVAFDGTYYTYETIGTLTSGDLLPASGVGDINSFDYSVYSLPTSTSLRLQFSQDNSNWYDEAGALNSSSTMALGSDTIDLTGLSWAGGPFYYRVHFASNGSYSPILSSISLNYTSNTVPSVPTLVSPADASNTTDNTPTLSANYTDSDDADVGTTNYRIASTNATDCLNNANIVASGASATTAANNEDTTFTPGSSIGADGAYYWCAQNNDGIDTSAWTSMGSFTLDTTAPTNIGIALITVDSATQVTVLANTASDATVGLHSAPYWFNETTDAAGGTDSTDWQAAATYIDTGLTPNTAYDYQVKARDTLSNESSFSSTVASTTVRTLAAVPASLSGSADSRTAITASWNANSNPAGTEYYAENTTASTNSGWITATSWTSSDLTCGTDYSFKVKARNANNTETAYTATVSVTTSACAVSGGSGLIFLQGLFGKTNDTAKKEETPAEAPPEEIPEIKPVKEIIIVQPEPFKQLPKKVAEAIEAEEVPPAPASSQQRILQSPLTANLGLDLAKIKELSKLEFNRLASLVNLYDNLKKLTSQFPSLQETLAKINLDIAKPENLDRIREVKFKLPGFAKSALAAAAIDLPSLAESMAISGTMSLAEIPAEAKALLPQDIIFARGAGDKIDLGIQISVQADNRLEQKINTTPNQPLTLALKPENTANIRVIKGYLVLRKLNWNHQSSPSLSLRDYYSAIARSEARKQSHLKSITFNLFPFIPAANAQTAPITEVNQTPIEDRLVLVEFEYTDPDGDGIYTADFQAPPVAGEYELITVIEYRDGTETKLLRLTTVIDPEGYIYAATPQGEVRLADAAVSLYWKNPQTGEYQLWPADQFSQTNPQITDNSGRYQYLVPAGRYYLTVERSDYHRFNLKEFDVAEGESIHQNIKLLPIINWQNTVLNWQILMSALVIILIILALIILIKLSKFKK